MSEFSGNFVWYDLMTPDMKASAEFYSNVVGWQTADSGMTPPYTILNMGSSMVGGIMGMSPEAAGAPPAWVGHIGVDDVDASVEKITAAGGAVHRPPADIPRCGTLLCRRRPAWSSVRRLQAKYGDARPRGSARPDWLARASRR